MGIIEKVKSMLTVKEQQERPLEENESLNVEHTISQQEDTDCGIEVEKRVISSEIISSVEIENKFSHDLYLKDVKQTIGFILRYKGFLEYIPSDILKNKKYNLIFEDNDLYINSSSTNISYISYIYYYDKVYVNRDFSNSALLKDILSFIMDVYLSLVECINITIADRENNEFI